MYKQEQALSYARALRSIHLFSPLLERGQFHIYLTTQGLSAVPRIFVFLTYYTKLTNTRMHSLIYNYY